MKRPELFLAMLFLLFGATGALRVVHAHRQDYHWTPILHQEPLPYGAKYFEVYMKGEKFTDLVQEGRVGLKRKEGKGGYVPVADSDVRVRVNHLHEVAKSQMATASALLASGVTLLAIGLSKKSNKK